MDSPDEFRAFVRMRAPALIRTAYLLTGDQHLSEDLLQNVLVRVARRWDSIAADGEPPEPYVRKALYREYLSWRRLRRNAELPAERLPESAGGDHSDDIALRMSLQRALRRLTRKQRAVVTLRFYEDLSEAETAQLLACSVGIVKSQTNRALRRLRELVPDLVGLLVEAPETVRIEEVR